MSIGSIEGMSKLGIPLTSDGRSFSILVTMHPFISGSLLWHICNTSAKEGKEGLRQIEFMTFFMNFMVILQKKLLLFKVSIEGCWKIAVTLLGKFDSFTSALYYM